MRTLSQWVQRIKPVISVDDSGNPAISLQLSDHQALKDLTDIFNLPQKLADDKPWIVVFDEFQDIEKLNGENFEKEMRSALIHHDNVGYVFLGSQTHLLQNMFNQRDRAFYKFGKMVELNKISPDKMQTYIIDHFQSSGLAIDSENADQIISIADNIPHYVQYLASAVWEHAVENNGFQPPMIAAAVQKIINNQTDYFGTLYHGLTPLQQKIIQALSQEGRGLFTEDYKQRYNLPAASSTQRAIERLLSLGLIEKEVKGYDFSDPFFKQWLKTI